MNDLGNALQMWNRFMMPGSATPVSPSQNGQTIAPLSVPQAPNWALSNASSGNTNGGAISQSPDQSGNVGKAAGTANALSSLADSSAAGGATSGGLSGLLGSI